MAPSRNSHESDLAEDLERLLQDVKPRNLAPEKQGAIEQDLPMSEALAGDLTRIDRTAFADEKAAQR